MTSPRRSKKCGDHSALSNLDWDSPSDETGTVKRRRQSCPENKTATTPQDTIFEIPTPSDSGSCTSRSIDDTDKTDSLAEVEERISSLINENRSSKSNSESSDLEIIIENILDNTNGESVSTGIHNEHEINSCEPRSNKNNDKRHNDGEQNISSIKDKVKDRKLKTPTPVRKFNKPLDIKKQVTSSITDNKLHDKISVLPVYKTSVNESSVELNSKKRVTSKLRLPFSPVRAMEKPKISFFHNKENTANKPSLLSSPVRRTISNEYVRLKFCNDTVMRRKIDGKSVPKITPKIQSIIPESPVDIEDPFLNLSPNKKYTVTVNNKVRCDKDNYVIFDPNTGFKSEDIKKQSRIPLKSPNGEKSKIPLKSPVGEISNVVARKSINVSDTDSGILSPNSPVENSADECSVSTNVASFSGKVKKCAADLDITILDPALAKKAVEQIKVRFHFF